VATVTGPEHHFRLRAGVVWSGDGKYLIYARNLPDEQDVELVRVPVEGGEPVAILRTPVINGLSLSPDGRRISFQSGEWKGEVWMIEGLPGTQSVALRANR
jgi:Tol biopolymer transport system component